MRRLLLAAVGASLLARRLRHRAAHRPAGGQGRPRRGAGRQPRARGRAREGRPGPAHQRRPRARLPRGPARPAALHGRRPQGRPASHGARGDRPALPRSARRRVRGEGAAGRPRGRRLLAARRPDRARRAPRLRAGRRRPRRATPARGASSCSRRAATRSTGEPGAGLLGHAGAHGRADGRRSRSCTWWTRCAPTTPASTATRATPRPSSTRSRRTPSSSRRRSRTRRGPSPRWRRSSPRTCPASTARCSCATRSIPSQVTLARPLDAHGFATGAAIANSVIYGEESAFDRGFDFFAGLHGDDDTRSKLVGADVVVDTALAFLRSRRGLPTFLYVHTMDPHVPYAPPAPFDRMFEPHATRRPSGARPAQRLQGAARPRADGGAVRRRRRLRRPRVRPLRARAEGARALRRRARRCSWPTTARSSSTTAAGCTAAACSTSWSASRWCVKLPGRPRPRRAHRAPGAGRRRDAHACSRRWARRCPPRPRRPPAAARARERRRRRGRRSRRSATAASWPTACAPRTRSTSGASAPTTTSCSSTCAGPGRADEHRRGESRAGAAAQGAGRGGHGAEPVPLRAAGARRRASSRSGSRPTAGSRRVEASGLGPQERSVVGGNGRSLEPRAAAARRERRARSASPCGRSGRR